MLKVATSPLTLKCAATLYVEAEKMEEVKVLHRQTYAKIAPMYNLRSHQRQTLHVELEFPLTFFSEANSEGVTDRLFHQTRPHILPVVAGLEDMAFHLQIQALALSRPWT